MRLPLLFYRAVVQCIRGNCSSLDVVCHPKTEPALKNLPEEFSPVIKRIFDSNRPYPFVDYLRMSQEDQNKRSPDQQLATIDQRLLVRRLPWKRLKSYRDEGKTARLLRNRDAYQQMLRDLKSGRVKADLILVDTMERFGRVDELQAIRKELDERYGILVLAADTDFADPNTPQGRAMAAVEGIRVTEDGRIKAHNVLRGKKDAVELGYWPGGQAPFGMMLQTVLKEVRGRQEVDHSLLVPNPDTRWIMELLFKKAEETGWGQTRLCRYLNQHEQIPSIHKPFQPSTIGYWLDLEIFYGEFVWPKCCSGVVDDAIIRVATNPEEIKRYPNYCEPLIDKSLWLSVQAIRNMHRARHHGGHPPKAADEDRLLQPMALGLVMKYLLTGLVVCGHCKRSMVPSPCPEYTDKQGVSKRYTAYLCPGYPAGHCPNGTRIKEDWLREVVIGRITERLEIQV